MLYFLFTVFIAVIYNILLWANLFRFNGNTLIDAKYLPSRENEINLLENRTNTLKMEENGIDRLYKVILVGDSGVGKTSLLMRLCKNEFKASMTATLGKLDYCTFFIAEQLVCQCCKYVTMTFLLSSN